MGEKKYSKYHPKELEDGTVTEFEYKYNASAGGWVPSKSYVHYD